MKNTMITSTLMIFLIFSGNVKAQNAQNTLQNIQQKVHTAFADAQQKNNTNSLNHINTELAELYKQNNQNLLLYWQAYAKYYTAVYYLTKNDKKQSEKEIEKAIEYLKSIKKKTSEDYALLSIVQGFSIQFKNMIKTIFLSKQVGKNGRLAIEKDDENLRGYLAVGTSDFYRPEQFGGGKIVEKNLLKAISLPSQKTKNTYLPSWGKEEAYEILIQWYIRKKNIEKAKKYHKEAMEKYPHNYMLKKLASKLKSNEK